MQCDFLDLFVPSLAATVRDGTTKTSHLFERDNLHNRWLTNTVHVFTLMPCSCTEGSVSPRQRALMCQTSRRLALINEK